MKYGAIRKKVCQILLNSDTPLTLHQINDQIPYRQRQNANVMANILGKTPHIMNVGEVDVMGNFGRYRAVLWEYVPEAERRDSYRKCKIWACRRCGNKEVFYSLRRVRYNCELCNSNAHHVHMYIG